MSLEKYFRNELDYIRELGREIADKKPHLAHFLSEQSADPDVERLLEGFAFLTGSLRAKVDDQFPEFTHSLINMLWPNYLRPMPSMTIVEFSQDKNVSESGNFIAKGTPLLSKPIQLLAEDTLGDDAKNQLQCTFRTCRDVWVLPLNIANASVYNSNEKSIISLTFTSESDMDLANLDFSKLRVYLGADDYSNHQLYLWLSYYLESAEFVVGNHKIPQPKLYFAPVGFGKADALLPYQKNAYSGYRILQEYFCFPDSFLFFDIAGVDAVPSLSTSHFTLNLAFSQPLSPDVQIRASTFKLHCVPAVNLFTHDSENILLDGQKTEYPLRSSHSHPEWYEIFSVDHVESFLQSDLLKNQGKARGNARVYAAFESFQHQIEYAQGRTALYYKLRTKDALFEQGFEHYLSFVRGDETVLLETGEILSVTTTCTNRDIPARLRVGDICQSANEDPASTRFRNITRPTLPLHPVLDGTLAWKLISNSSLNYLSLLDTDALKEIIKTYDLPSWHSRRNAKMSQKRLDGIERIQTEPIDRLFKGVTVRGLQSTLYVKQSAFQSEGDLFLFCTVLSHFFSLYASLNSFHKLKVVNIENQETYEWPIQIGQHSLM
ncbi:type VI secretion protein [[Actinobacillus] muris]|uniref:Type VI secretion protein n=2 Tax=Muribacter muris TaxID=67855 RepID=A0A0J5P1P8_9PAST|nr:type VI secretion system baseplate subunit TssF [Muribacter muris]KMK50443.1 type VI secretion protein [[Actinobacillus] muris] [Muribacter muris]